MKCPHCQGEMPINKEFCPRCGNKVNAAFDDIAASVHEDAAGRRAETMNTALLRLFLVVPVLGVIVYCMNDYYDRRLSATGAEPPGLSAPPAPLLPPPALPPPALREPPLPAPPPEVFPRCFSYRRGRFKETLRTRNGGRRESRRAVEKALRRLAAMQLPSGAWPLKPLPAGAPPGEVKEDRTWPPSEPAGPRWEQTGLSALVLLCFLGEGEIKPADIKNGRQRPPTPFETVVEKGVRFILSRQDKESGRIGPAARPGGLPAHAVATQVLAEAAGLSGDGRLRKAAAAAVTLLLKEQGSDGAWRISGATGEQGRICALHNSFRAVEALLSAREAGLKVPAEVLARAAEYFRRRLAVAVEPTKAGKLHFNLSPTTAAAALCAALRLGVPPDDPGARAVREELRRYPPRFEKKWRGFRADTAAAEVRVGRARTFVPLRWYAATYAFFFFGGREWEEWNAALVKALPALQSGDGSWKANDPTSLRHGAAQATAAAVLALQAPYRFRR